jgi:Domain of unknown function (DUF4304)
MEYSNRPVLIMEKKNLENIISEVFTPLGFEKKGNYWTLVNNEITKIINLQKSQFSNRFYINYGYIINSIPLNGLKMHIFSGFGSADISVNESINELLDLDNIINDAERQLDLYTLIKDNLFEKLQAINTEEELANYLKALQPPLSNMIPGIVKNYFNIPF